MNRAKMRRKLLTHILSLLTLIRNALKANVLFYVTNKLPVEFMTLELFTST